LNLLVSGNPENRLDNGLVGSTSDDVGIRPFSKHETQRIDQNRLSCAGLACDNIQAALEFHLDFFDEGVVLDEKGFEHRPIPWTAQMYRKKAEFQCSRLKMNGPRRGISESQDEGRG